MIQVSKTSLEGVLRISPSVFKDARGQFVETYNEALYKKNGINATFVQDDISVSKKNVLRGIHGDNETAKLLSCLYGELYFVVVNCDTDSKDFGKWESFVLSGEDRQQIFVPAKYGNAYLMLSEEGILSYKQSTNFVHGKQFSYRWDDPKFNITWPITNPILSERDRTGEYA